MTELETQVYNSLLLAVPTGKPIEQLARLADAWLKLSGHTDNCQCSPCMTAKAITYHTAALLISKGD